MSLLASLNPQQRAAAENAGGPMLILAGAGSGKTRVITYRIAHLIASGVAPWKIIAVTFTNKAAGEMRDRVSRLVAQQAAARPGAPADIPWVGTFHAYCLRLLRREAARAGLRPNFVVHDQDDARALVKACERDLGIDDKEHLPARVQGRISRLKGDCVTPEDFAAKARRPGADLADAVLADVYALYQKRLVDANACDFDDLLMRAVLLLERDPAVRASWQGRTEHLLVDEYQDTNPIQYRLIRLLAGEHENVCAVGDEDQSIYRFRGADIRNILDFEKDFPGTRIFRIEQNYRSTGTILAAANAVVARNVARKGKVLWTENPAGDEVTVRAVEDDLAEADWIASQVRGLLRDHDAGDIAVMYRTNAQSRVLEEAFGRARIPHVVIGGMRFYERREVKDVLAYLRLALNGGDELAFDRIVNVPARGLGRGTVEALRTLSRERGSSMWDASLHAISEGLLPGRAEVALERFVELIADLRRDAETMPLPELVQSVIDRSKYLGELAKEGPDIARDRKENLDELVSAAAQHEELEAEASLATFLTQISLTSDADALGGDERVPLLTIHSAKGLEFDVVFLAGLEEGLFPHASSLDHPDDIEEERRLCYVGMTRARHRLFLSHAHRRRLWGQMRENLPSRFLAEIPSEHVRREGTARIPVVPTAARGASAALASFFGSDAIAVEDISQETAEDEPVFDRGAQAPEVAAPAEGDAPSRPKPFRKGDRVEHPKFGPGLVMKREMNGGSAFVTVYFERTYRTVKLAEAHAKLVAARR